MWEKNENRVQWEWYKGCVNGRDHEMTVGSRLENLWRRAQANILGKTVSQERKEG